MEDITNAKCFILASVTADGGINFILYLDCCFNVFYSNYKVESFLDYFSWFTTLKSGLLYPFIYPLASRPTE
jgi:hypothetical protein